MNPPLITSRREFLKTSGTAVAGAALATTLTTPRAGYCAEDNAIKIALVGCGGRGTGAAANALATKGPVKLWAMADVVEQRLEGSLQSLSAKHTSQMFVPPERRFVSFDGFKHAIDSLGKGGVVLLATPPAFRPIHFEYAVQKGVHVFMEKSFGVDAPGIRRVLKAGELAAQKNLKVATGLMSRHYLPLEEAIQRIHEGAIGELITCWAYRMHGPVGFTPRKPGVSELAHQIHNYSNFTWLNGSFLVDWLIHNLDVCCWAKNAWPKSVQGMGGRQVRDVPDQMFDHCACEFSFPDGTKMFAQGRHQSGCHDVFGDVLHGTKGSAVLGEGQTKPRFFKGYEHTSQSVFWSSQGAPCDHYQREHDLLFEAVRQDRPYNEVERSAKSCLTAILGRMAVESGKLVTWEEALNSNAELAPGLEQINSLAAPAPTQPDSSGKYPVAMPGRTQVL
jgi:predicted dehydrogenase